MFGDTEYFPKEYWPLRAWAERYWPFRPSSPTYKLGYWPERYWDPPYWPKVYWPVLAGGGPGPTHRRRRPYMEQFEW